MGERSKGTTSGKKDDTILAKKRKTIAIMRYTKPQKVAFLAYLEYFISLNINLSNLIHLRGFDILKWLDKTMIADIANGNMTHLQS
jgi:hypothetical protein